MIGGQFYDDPLRAAFDLLEHPGIRFLDGHASPINADGSLNYREGFTYGWDDVDRPNTDIAMNVLDALSLGRKIYVDDRHYPQLGYALSFSVFHLTEMGAAVLSLCKFEEDEKILDRVFDEED